MREFINEKHNEVVEIEERLIRASGTLTDLSNYLYNVDPSHALLEEISDALRSVEMVDFEAHYAEERAAAGESWWDEA